ncbi:MAG: 4-hydroxythreonine-4-phosphate dehydrogenase [Deltaproteobacteria bacterium]|nr:4-hydroxythreonine-4-phosphate dehydrogenase [Deltaproteobacteria bacterium]
MTAPLVLSVGDPAGIGPEVAVEACLRERPASGVVLVGDALDLGRRLGARARRLRGDEDWRLEPHEIAIAHVCEVPESVVRAHAPSVEGGRAQLAFLDAAIDAVQAGRASALVTGPTSKQAISLGGEPFSGQTEHLARRSGLAPDAVTMLFLGPTLRVALVTTHVAIRDLPEAVSPARVERAIVHLVEVLEALRGKARPVEALRVAVVGLNPHAGEGGLFGDEESLTIAPAIRAARLRLAAVSGVMRSTIAGPVPAEAAFRQAVAGRWDGVVAMMHDQATIASKLLDFGEAVNVTWGLPFVRASVDHGVAYDAAVSGSADASGMMAALRMAQRLIPG